MQTDRTTKALLALIALVVAFALQVNAHPVEIQNCVDINTAGSEELQRIIHIGPQRAGQIAQLRQQKRFETVDELVRVRGIAAARLRDIKAQGLACVRSNFFSERSNQCTPTK